jgi:hypothetical protein
LTILPDLSIMIRPRQRYAGASVCISKSIDPQLPRTMAAVPLGEAASDQYGEVKIGE